ncbi:FecR family protein [Pedobacter sp. SL55]|uniref:FecR family protein n=1 Tax=Pedobacter sp. SL55 TaxID=2995161 RepID=UPI00226D6C02|nr:FecR family protein [Pedobacter sp. SL55]WAC39894.1 FecR domain-containing protein [Pedobacter sp. SL55]
MEQKTKFEKLFNRYLNSEVTANDLNALFKDMAEVNEMDLRNHINQELLLDDELAPADTVHLQSIFAKIEEKIEKQPKTKVIKITTWYKAAAVAAVVFGISYLALYSGSSTKNEIIPGSNKAVLVINNEETLLNSESQSSFSPAAAISVTTAANGNIIYKQKSNDTTGLSALHAISTPAGGFYKITLGDGTQVYLNSKSTLEFPVGFYGPERHVKLSGEAYFKVAKNKKMPFIVSVGQTNVKVLGTAFTINSFGKQTKTTLYEGSVQLNYLSNRKILAPGQEGLSDRNGILVNQADTAAAKAWTNGLFVFNDQALADVLHELSRWYDFSFDENSIPNKRLYIRLNRNTAFKDVLEMLYTTTGLKFKVEERRLSIDN